MSSEEVIKTITAGFEVRARELCRAHGLPESEANVRVLVAAMEHGASRYGAYVNVRLRSMREDLQHRREVAGAPQ